MFPYIRGHMPHETNLPRDHARSAQPIAPLSARGWLAIHSFEWPTITLVLAAPCSYISMHLSDTQTLLLEFEIDRSGSLANRSKITKSRCDLALALSNVH